MKQYRVVEVARFNNIYYELQVKTWWFFWKTLTQMSFGGDSGGLDDDLRFTSRQAAKNYFMKYIAKPKRTIIKIDDL